MAVLPTENPNLLDVMAATNEDSSIAALAEILNETNEVLDDWTMMEGNLATGHRSSVRSGIPKPTWRQLYGFVQPTKSQRATVIDTCGMLEAFSEIDVAEAELNDNSVEFRLSEDLAHIEGMSQEASAMLFYGNEAVDPAKFTGLASRYSDLSSENGQDNIIDAGGVGTDNASIWLVGWGPRSCFGIYPKGSKAGLQMKDFGERVIQDQSGGRMVALQTHYRWDLGLALRDWRYVVRIANIDRSALTPDAASGANLPQLMFEATERVPNLSGARFSFYMDRKLRTKLRQQVASGVTNSTLTTEQVGGVRITTFDEIPVRRCDALAVDEARVT